MLEIKFVEIQHKYSAVIDEVKLADANDFPITINPFNNNKNVRNSKIQIYNCKQSFGN